MLSQSRQGQRHILSKKQQRLNQQTLNRLKKSSPSPIKGVQFNNQDQEENKQKTNFLSPLKNDKGINKQYGSFLKEQMSLQRLNGDDQLAKSRKLDQQNASYLKQKYPFGFEGVKKCEDVIEKYKASNYIINRGMLQEFERKAEDYRRNRMKKYKKPQQEREIMPQRYTEPLRKYESAPKYRQQINNYPQKVQLQDLLKKRSEDEGKVKKDIDKKNRKIKRQEGYMLRQKENLIKVGNMLRQIDHKIKQNSSKLSSQLKDFKEFLRQKDEENRYKMIDEKKIQSIVQKMARNSQSCSKIPVIMYNSIIDPNLRYNQSSFLPSRVNRSDFKAKYNDVRQIVQILRKNQNRLKMLTQNSSYLDQIKTNISF